MHVSFSYLEVFKAKPDQGSLIILMIVNNFTMLSSYYNAQKEKKKKSCSTNYGLDNAQK
jgi:abortive infection bacteriophage resistance protein